MNVKTTITIPERYLQYAEKMVENDAPADPLAGMADGIRRRMELPMDQWLAWDGTAMSGRIKARLREKYEK